MLASPDQPKFWILQIYRFGSVFTLKKVQNTAVACVVAFSCGHDPNGRSQFDLDSR